MKIRIVNLLKIFGISKTVHLLPTIGISKHTVPDMNQENKYEGLERGKVAYWEFFASWLIVCISITSHEKKVING